MEYITFQNLYSMHFEIHQLFLDNFQSIHAIKYEGFTLPEFKTKNNNSSSIVLESTTQAGSLSLTEISYKPASRYEHV